MGLGTINRDGRPQQLQPSGKFTRWLWPKNDKYIIIFR
jgi:hypothetical protein